MKRNHISLLLLMGLSLIFLLVLVMKPVKSIGYGQASFQTPTPNEQGQIIYTVQEGDTCTRIFLLTGVPIDQIIELNNLDDSCNVFPEQELILGTVAVPTATPLGREPTPTLGLPTPTASEGSGELCVVLFEDLDGNQMRSEEEFYLAGGVISVNNRVGTYSETEETVGGDPELVDPVCFENIPEGDYNLSMGIPEGYIATTSLNYAMEIAAGQTVVIDFGAQPSSLPAEAESADVDDGRSPLLLAIGLFLLAGGAGLAFFFIRSRQSS